MRKIHLKNLENEIPEISKAFRAIMLEAAQYCLNVSGHKSGVTLKISGEFDETIQLFWDKSTISNEEHITWRDKKEATRYAAKGIAILLIKELTEYTHFERLYQGLGIDFFLSDNNEKVTNRNLSRLEVSGLFKETKGNTLNIRIGNKKNQVKKSDFLGFSVYIVVVEFEKPSAKIIRNE